jgi:hypothetical protein
MYEDELRTQYRALLEKQRLGPVTEDDTLRLLVVYAELDRLGYVLNKDESDWVKRKFWCMNNLVLWYRLAAVFSFLAAVAYVLGVFPPLVVVGLFVANAVLWLTLAMRHGKRQ